MEISDGLVSDPIRWKRPGDAFYLDPDVVKTARALLGMKLVSFSGNVITSGIITETEAYAGVSDRASHACGGRRTRRTETMYRKGGVSYVYLCYGVHSLINVVTGPPDIPHAVLIRGIIPADGLSVMKDRSGNSGNILSAGSGPGKVSKLLGIDCSSNGTDLVRGNLLWIEASRFRFSDSVISVTKRIGVDYAGEDALLPYRFVADLKAAQTEIEKAGIV